MGRRFFWVIVVGLILLFDNVPIQAFSQSSLPVIISVPSIVNGFRAKLTASVTITGNKVYWVSFQPSWLSWFTLNTNPSYLDNNLRLSGIFQDYYFSPGAAVSMTYESTGASSSCGPHYISVWIGYIGKYGPASDIVNMPFTEECPPPSPPPPPPPSNISITVSPNALYPSGLGLQPTTSQIHVSVTNADGSAATAAQNLLFTVSVPPDHHTQLSLENRGGHANSGSRPLGIFQGKNPQDYHLAVGDQNNEYQFQDTTDSNGNLDLTYTSPAAGGVILIQVSLLHDSSGAFDPAPSAVIIGNGTASAGIDVRVPGLVHLPDDPDLYTKDGGTIYHPGPCLPKFASSWEKCDPNTDYTEGYPNIDINHYGNPLFMDKIVAITQEFKAVFPSETVLLNDMSLPLGGVFDINGDWEPPHLDHQEGEAVDYNLLYFPLGFNSTSVEAERLAWFIRRKHLNIHVEGDHWHIQMKPGQF